MKIRRQALEEIEIHARECLPAECCGIVMARGNDPDEVTHVIRSENLEEAHPKERYALGHDAHIKAVEMELSGDAQIAGYYHSHPRGGTRPSSTDRRLAVPGVLYFIAAVDEGPARHAAWRLEGSELVQAPLEVR